MSLRTLKNLPIWSLCLQFNHDILLCQGICDELNFQFLINLEEAFWAFSINLENNSLHHVWQIFWLHKFITKIRRSKIPDLYFKIDNYNHLLTWEVCTGWCRQATNMIFKWAIPGLFYVYFRSFSNKYQYNFTAN